MAPAVAADPILRRFRAALDEMYGDRIERVVLFGSRARGDANADSDYDIALFLSQAYNLKSVADYELGPGADVPLDRAEQAIDRVAR